MILAAILAACQDFSGQNPDRIRIFKRVLPQVLPRNPGKCTIVRISSPEDPEITSGQNFSPNKTGTLGPMYGTGDGTGTRGNQPPRFDIGRACPFGRSETLYFTSKLLNWQDRVNTTDLPRLLCASLQSPGQTRRAPICSIGMQPSFETAYPNPHRTHRAAVHWRCVRHGRHFAPPLRHRACRARLGAMAATEARAADIGITDVDVAVVGGGPAGLVTARALRTVLGPDAGIRVGHGKVAVVRARASKQPTHTPTLES